MRKKIYTVIFFIVFAFIFSGCGKKYEKDTLSIVSVNFPGYDFARQIAKDNASVYMLLSPGSESHSFEPTPQDILKIQNCDLFIYNGGESDEWVSYICNSLQIDNGKIIKMTDCVPLIEEKTTPEMTLKGERETEPDEHVWCSISNAKMISSKIAEKLIEIDPANNDDYTENLKTYLAQLDELDKKIKKITAYAKKNTLVFADRFPAAYFTAEYGLDYLAAFPGCSGESEPSAATIAALINYIKKNKTKAVFYIELSNRKIADTICEETGTKKLLFHSCHNISRNDFENNETYISLMNKNAENIEEALK